MKKGKILKTLAIAGTCLCAPLLLSGCTSGDENKTDPQNFRVQDGWVQFTQDGETWTNLIEAEYPISKYDFRIRSGYVQWTTDGTTWKNLIKAEYPISEYDFRVYNGYVQWTTDGSTWTNLIKAEEETKTYTITFDYGIADEMFSTSPSSLTLNSDEWLVGLPSVKSDFKNVFLGWFVSGSDKQIKEYDFIGGNVTLEARFDIYSEAALSGLYENGKYVKTWQDIKTEFPLAFKTDKTISGRDTFSSYLSSLSGELVIDNGITTIENGAFVYSDLTSVAIPSSVTSIGYAAFTYSKLTSIVVNENNTVYDSRNNCNAIIKTDTNELMTGCNTTIIPSSVTSIGARAFEGCRSLSSIAIPSSVTSIGGSAFEGCRSLISIAIPSSVTSMENNVFTSCYSLTNIVVDENNTVYDSRNNCNAIIKTDTNELMVGCNTTIIPSSVTSIGESAFEGCYSLTNIEIPSSVTSIGSYAFKTCRSLISIAIPSSVTSIGYAAFSNCYSLTSIEIPSSVTSIGVYAFSSCDSLTNIEIPSSVTSIGQFAFLGCDSLTTITFEEKEGYKWQVLDKDAWIDAEESELFNLTKASKQLRRVAE